MIKNQIIICTILISVCFISSLRSQSSNDFESKKGMISLERNMVFDQYTYNNEVHYFKYWSSSLEKILKDDIIAHTLYKKSKKNGMIFIGFQIVGAVGLGYALNELITNRDSLSSKANKNKFYNGMIIYGSAALLSLPFYIHSQRQLEKAIDQHNMQMF